MKQLLKTLFLRYSPGWLLLYAKKRHYLKTVKAASELEEPDLKVVKYLVRKGETVGDIGANIGVYTRALSQMVGTEGEVLSFEPIPATFAILSNTVRRCGLGNVRLFNCALTDQEVMLTMEVPRYESGGENYYEARIVSGQKVSPYKTFSIPGKPLDALTAPAKQPVTFIKCDVEGNELSVIKGAQRLIEKDHPAFLIEVCADPDQQSTSAFELFRRMRSYGYEAYFLKDGIFKKRAAGEKSVNYFFLQKHHLSRLDHTEEFTMRQE